MNTTMCITQERPMNRVLTPVQLLQTVFAALNARNIHRAIDQFVDNFVFHDNALDLEFTNKERLTEFFRKSFELFPDTAVELVCTFECDDYAIAEWKLTATHTEAFGSLSHRSRIALLGSTIVQAKHGRIIRWSDYYDQLASRRTKLGAFFEEWVEY